MLAIVPAVALSPLDDKCCREEKKKEKKEVVHVSSAHPVISYSLMLLAPTGLSIDDNHNFRLLLRSLAVFFHNPCLLSNLVVYIVLITIILQVHNVRPLA